MTWAVLALVLAAVGLRAWGLEAKSLWFDEAFTFFVATKRPGDLLALVRANDAHPPLFYLLTHAVVPLWSREVGVRLLAVGAGSLTVLITYLVGRHLLGRRAALVAAGLLAISPAHVMASQEGRMYALLGLLGLLSWGCLYLATYARRTWWLGYVTATALALYTHYLALVILATQALFVAAEPSARRSLRAWTLAACAAVLLFLPWVPALTDQVIAGRMYPAHRPPLSVLSLAQAGALFQYGGGLQTAAYVAYPRGEFPLVYYAPLLLPLVLVLAAAFLGREGPSRQRLWLACYLLGPILLLLAVSLRTNLFQVRYFVVLTPAYALAASFGVETIAGFWQRHGGRAVAIRAFMLVWLGLFSFAGLQTHYRAATWDGHDWRAGVAYLDARTATLDALAVIPGVINIPYSVYTRKARMAALGDPRTYLDASRTDERAAQRRVLRQAAGRGDVWLLTLAPLADPVAGGLSADLRGLAAEKERKSFGSFVVVHFARTGER